MFEESANTLFLTLIVWRERRFDAAEGRPRPRKLEA
jgi:hypothetical protein